MGKEIPIDVDDQLGEIQYHDVYDHFSTSDISNESSTDMINQSEYKETSRYPVRNRNPKQYLDFKMFQTVLMETLYLLRGTVLHGKNNCKWKDAMKCEDKKISVQYLPYNEMWTDDVLTKSANKPKHNTSWSSQSYPSRYVASSTHD